jgi:hypothetical protein
LFFGAVSAANKGLLARQTAGGDTVAAGTCGPHAPTHSAHICRWSYRHTHTHRHDLSSSSSSSWLILLTRHAHVLRALGGGCHAPSEILKMNLKRAPRAPPARVACRLLLLRPPVCFGFKGDGAAVARWRGSEKKRVRDMSKGVRDRLWLERQ